MTSRALRALVVSAVIAGMLAVGAVWVAHADPAATDASASASAVPAETEAGGFSAGGLQDPAERPSDDAATDAVPVRVQIPRIGVDSTLEDLGIGAAGELTAPVDYDLAGWYSGGVVPGQIGPAIIAGHVDSPVAPAVFARIGELVDGDEVIVTMSAGEPLVFEISGRAQSAKSTFPTDAVYRNVPRPGLRLITCAGSFDRSIGHYTDNLILFASLRA